MSRATRWGRVALVVAGLGLWAGSAAADTYDVTVYNLTKGQVISPPVVAAHAAEDAIFRAGTPASEELAALAEDADDAALIALLGGLGADVEQPFPKAPILPGGHVTIQIETSDGNVLLSAVGMLVTTNDAFFGLNSVPLVGSSATFSVPAYDAGSEANNEDCRFIPGPPCGNPFVRATEGAEGFVHIHNGIHTDNNGAASLNASRDDWRNPVARVVITPVE